LKKNSGFSLVELIIAVAIMTILIGILAPQYLKYVEKSRMERDKEIAEEIRKACQMAENDTDEDLESGEYTVTIAKNHDITVDADKGGNKTHLETYLKSVLGPNFQKERLKSKSFSTINVKFSNFSIPTCNITYTNSNGNVTPN